MSSITTSYKTAIKKTKFREAMKSQSRSSNVA